MHLFTSLFDQAAARWSARAFDAPHAVTLRLDPSAHEDALLIDKVTAWSTADERSGKVRRTVHAARGEIVFEFETAVDAVECALRFR